MILLIDIGNSRTKYVELSNNTISPITSITNHEFTASYFDNNFMRMSQVVVANVAQPDLTSVLASWCHKHDVFFTQVHSEQHKNNLVSAYKTPKKLGVDRWLALLAAVSLFPAKSCLIIDAGTATTIDLLAHSGQHQGGWILAGVNSLVTTLLTHSTLVDANTTALASVNFGFNTSDNVHNASWAATLGMVHQAIKQTQQEMPLDHIIFTGGNGQALTELLRADKQPISDANYTIEYIDNLIFFGLKQYV